MIQRSIKTCFLETNYDGNWATIVADVEIAIFEVESFRSKRGFSTMTDRAEKLDSQFEAGRNLVVPAVFDHTQDPLHNSVRKCGDRRTDCTSG